MEREEAVTSSMFLYNLIVKISLSSDQRDSSVGRDPCVKACGYEFDS